MRSSVTTSRAVDFDGLRVVDETHGDHPLRCNSAAQHGDNRRAPRLTPRQREVLSLLCEGSSNKRIARELDIATTTVKVHVADILRELGVSSRLQAVVVAHQFGLVPLFGAAEPCEAAFAYDSSRRRQASARMP